MRFGTEGPLINEKTDRPLRREGDITHASRPEGGWAVWMGGMGGMDGTGGMGGMGVFWGWAGWVRE